MTWGKIGSKTDKGNTEFRCSLKTERMTEAGKFMETFSLLKTGSHKEINSGVSFLNLVDLKITQTRKNLQLVFHHGLNPKMDHFCPTNNFAVFALSFFSLQSLFFDPWNRNQTRVPAGVSNVSALKGNSKLHIISMDWPKTDTMTSEKCPDKSFLHKLPTGICM